MRAIIEQQFCVYNCEKHVGLLCGMKYFPITFYKQLSTYFTVVFVIEVRGVDDAARCEQLEIDREGTMTRN